MRDGKPLDGSSVVVIGASAGGIEALERLAAALPQGFEAPLVIAQHADPKVPSHLAQILGRQTSMNVVTVEDRVEHVLPGHIYVATAGRNLILRNGTVTGSPRLRGHPIPSIDALFESAAENYGDQVIALILTGMGTDGVAGVRAVKEHGGTVIVQEPESAAFPSLPAAIPFNHIDFTATLESLPSLLTTLVASDRLSSEIANPDVLRAFLDQLRTRSGIDFRQYKTPTIVRRLTRLMAASGHTSLSDYMRYLGSNSEAYQRLISTFLIKVTGFFRDPALFAQLRETILPELIDHARKTQSELRLWSAGCATGEEAYSLAITLADLLGDDLDQLPVRIFATDLDPDAVASARRGIYPLAAFKDMPPQLLTKYFTRVDDTYQVTKRVRNLTVFGEYDLGQRAPFPRIDLVLCRNVLIYFAKELQQRTLQLFAFSLRVGGYLVLGKAETTNTLPQYFALVNPALKIFRRQGDRLLIPAPTIVEGVARADRPIPRRIAMRTTIAPRRMSGDGGVQRWTLVDRLGAFLFESPVGIVVVDRNYDILTINQAARAHLGVHGQGIGEDLIHLANVPSNEFKAALDGAFRGQPASEVPELEIHDTAVGQTKFLQVSCYPDPTAPKDARIENVFVLVADVTDGAKFRRQIELENEQNREALERLSAQNAELRDRQRALTEANAELTAANADLRSTNEHLLIAAEEAEASAEEVETLNEEMQATSEELETLNEELQATVEELNTTNEELAARTNELEVLARQRQEQLDESAQALETLRSVIERVPLAMCLLDDKSRVTSASDRYRQLAEAHDGLPAVGDPWRHAAQSIALGERRGQGTRFKIIATKLQGGVTMLILEPSKSE
ncbi:MAG: PAS domain-containing protein [Candidatus Eremiobacteraeota bacterium]|nr:PAS domain-containing protein [Candidatus Eremiobacteraeota bacterium]